MGANEPAKPKYLITNVVYGPVYSQLFLEQHLKSILDETNLPDLAEKYDIEYLILTDLETTPLLQQHPNMQRLTNTVKLVNIFNFEWGNVQDKFARRYDALLDLFKISVRKGLNENFQYVTCWVADLVVAKDFFSKLTERMDSGHDAVFVLPMRSAADSMVEKLDEWEGALPALKLCKFAYENLHPLWWACHWDNPMFTKYPFTLLWNNGRGLKAHSYLNTPIIFKPREGMLAPGRRGMIDVDVPELCENPYLATDWIDAPVIAVEPLFCYYPPFSNRPSSVSYMREWQHVVHPSHIKNLGTPLYYPSKLAMGEIDVRGIPEQITTGYTPPVQVQAPAPPPEKLNRAQRRALERGGK